MSYSSYIISISTYGRWALELEWQQVVKITLYTILTAKIEYACPKFNNNKKGSIAFGEFNQTQLCKLLIQRISNVE